MAGPAPHRYRLSDGERDEALARLRTALEEGRLDAEEHADRSGAVLEALTNTDLVPVFEDLPAACRPSALAVPGAPQPGDEHPYVPSPAAGGTAARRKEGEDSPGRHKRPHAGGLAIWGGIIFVLWGVPSISSGNTGAIFAWLFFLAVFIAPGLVVASVQAARNRNVHNRAGGGRRAIG
ncbi:DUF1707 domain-containing protein [Nocardiopsis sp. NPDC058631]|uniref:DUF1707 SHOCT-like domain-containing protein n=1 Tax=Nocardiopsis sp. NPDC058631 TaxID=3346566 RepID=UPI003662A6D5